MTMVREFRFGQQRWCPAAVPRLMGIVNVTPDSFSDGGRFLDHPAAEAHARQLIADGADILDIGGESTRPGAEPVGLAEELRRVIPVVERLAGLRCPISVDTTKSQVAREALAAGASIVNDISGLTFDPQMIDVCAASDCGVLVMHIQGTPQTMQLNPSYADVVFETREFLEQRVRELVARGISAERILLDPGVGFGKTAEHNLAILRSVSAYQSTGRPVLIGHSRKRFLGKLLGRSLEERGAGTLGVSIALAQNGADYLRVHDVAATRDALAAWNVVRTAGVSEV